MYLRQIELRNFRGFGDSQIIEFNKGLNVLVGENDSGKSAIIDAIRFVLGTTDQSWNRVELSDFHNEEYDRVIEIICKFCGLSEREQAAFLECLSYEKVDSLEVPCLYLHWTCKYLLNFSPPRISVNMTTGINGDCPTPSTNAKELLRATYLRPLRDAYSNMQAGRGSRLSQIMKGIPNMNEGESQSDDTSKLSLTGIADLMNKLLAEHTKLKSVNTEIGSILKEKMLLKGDTVSTLFEVSGTDATESQKLSALLEKLDLSIQNNLEKGRVGLGTSNILSMACELLLSGDLESSFLLIEEPEAHIHAQRQLRLIKSLQDAVNAEGCNRQIILTTHSPLLASVVNLENITIIKNAKPYSLEHKYTKLNKNDYSFLERYLDATKSNLFFARSVLIVEGPSEELLLPTIARLLSRDFTEYGVSVVNVRGTGLSRYAKIFQRVDENNQLNIPVACVADRDIMPDCAPGICINEKYVDTTKWPESRQWKTESDYPEQVDKDAKMKEIKDRADGQLVKTFVADHWTFEYDLAFAGLEDEIIEAIVNVKYIPENREAKIQEIKANIAQFDTEEKKASYIYSFFKLHSVSKAEVSQQLAVILEKKYTNPMLKIEDKLPSYILAAIKYVTS